MKQKKLVLQGYSYSPDCEEISTTIELHRKYGGVRMTATVVHTEEVRNQNLEQILAKLSDLFGVGLEFSTDSEEHGRIAEWLEQIQKDDAA